MLPTTLDLKAVQQRWYIEYFQSTQTRITIQQYHPHTLIIRGPLDEKNRIYSALKKWLIKHAKRCFFSWLQKLEQETTLSFNHLNVRGQKTMWGSCSNQSDISLNYKLLFLPDYLANHVMLHELCHTLHFNHSPAFWQKLEELDPNTQQFKAQLKNADDFLPDWIN